MPGHLGRAIKFARTPAGRKVMKEAIRIARSEEGRKMIAHSAQEVGGKLYILGGGWSITGPDPVPMAIALKLEVPWDRTNVQHKLLLELLDEDGEPVMVPGPEEHGEVPLQVTGEFEAG